MLRCKDLLKVLQGNVSLANDGVPDPVKAIAPCDHGSCLRKAIVRQLVHQAVEQRLHHHWATSSLAAASDRVEA